MLENIRKWLYYIDNNNLVAEKLLKEKLKYEQQKRSYKEFLEEKFIPKAKEHGFDFSTDEFESFIKQCGGEKLTMDALEDVSGGKLSVFSNVGLGIFSLTLLSAAPTMVSHAGASMSREKSLRSSASQSANDSNRPTNIESSVDENIVDIEDDQDDIPVEIPAPIRSVTGNIIPEDERDDEVTVEMPIPVRSAGVTNEISDVDKFEVVDDSDEDEKLPPRISNKDDVNYDFEDSSEYYTSDTDDTDDESLDELPMNQFEILKGFYYMTNDSCQCVGDKDEFVEKISNICSCVEKEKALVTAPTGNALIIGDLHGNITSANSFIVAVRLALERNEVASVIFLGDYIDRGVFSVEVLDSLFNLKMDFNDRVFIIRGNHETDDVYPKNFPESLREVFEETDAAFIESKLYNDLFQKLPLAVEIPFENGEKVLCLHGGIPVVDDVYVRKSDVKRAFDEMKQENARGLFTYYEEVFRQMLWNDPDNPDKVRSSVERKKFTEEQLASFLSEFGYRSLIRSHESLMDGFREQFDGKCCTVFSTNDYCGIGNTACIAIATADGVFNYLQLSPSGEDRFVYDKASYNCMADAIFEFANSVDDVNDAQVPLTLGLCYCYGKGTQVDLDKALTYHKKAIELGSKSARKELTIVLGKLIQEYKERLGSIEGAKKQTELEKKLNESEKEYISLCEELAGEGEDFARYNLGRYYYDHKDYDKAIFWLGQLKNIEYNDAKELLKLYDELIGN